MGRDYISSLSFINFAIITILIIFNYTKNEENKITNTYQNVQSFKNKILEWFAKNDGNSMIKMIANGKIAGLNLFFGLLLIVCGKFGYVPESISNVAVGLDILITATIIIATDYRYSLLSIFFILPLIVPYFMDLQSLPSDYLLEYGINLATQSHVEIANSIGVSIAPLFLSLSLVFAFVCIVIRLLAIFISNNIRTAAIYVLSK